MPRPAREHATGLGQLRYLTENTDVFKAEWSPTPSPMVARGASPSPSLTRSDEAERPTCDGPLRACAAVCNRLLSVAGRGAHGRGAVIGVLERAYGMQ